MCVGGSGGDGAVIHLFTNNTMTINGDVVADILLMRTFACLVGY